MTEPEGMCIFCGHSAYDNTPTVKIIVHLACLKMTTPPETTVREAKKEDFKVNAWHKPSLEDV